MRSARTFFLLERKRAGRKFAVSFAGARTHQAGVQPIAASTHPAGVARRIAEDERVIGDIPGHDRARAYRGVLANRDSADDGRIGSDRGAAAAR